MAYISKFTDLDGSTYDLKSKVTNGILYGEVDSTSTATEFTAQIPGITEYYDGLTILLRNGIVTSASGFTININGLGGKPSYSNMTLGNDITPTDPTRDTTIFNINYAMIFVYNTTVVSTGCWICYRGYDANTNTLGYQLRTNSYILKTISRTRYYRILFTSADNTHWVPANTTYDNSATSVKTPNPVPINPFGEIVYLGNSTNYAAEADVAATAIWQQYTFALGYSFNTTGVALTLTTRKPVYVKCAPQSDGSAIIDSTTPYVQELPSTDDGKIYILLGMAYSATNIELLMNHPVYYYKDGAVRLWTNSAAASSITVDPTPTSGSTNAVSSGGVYTALEGKQDTLYFDTVPTSLSSNPVTSDGIYTALQGKQDTLTFDSVPTHESTNSVDSGGIYSAIEDAKVSILESAATQIGLILDSSTNTVSVGNGFIYIMSCISTQQKVLFGMQDGYTYKIFEVYYADIALHYIDLVSVGEDSISYIHLVPDGTAAMTGQLITTSIPTATSDLTNDSGFITNSAIANMQTTGNLVTSMSSSSTDTQYPSAKLVYDTVGNLESLLAAI